jgi:hypothetical protein
MACLELGSVDRPDRRGLGPRVAVGSAAHAGREMARSRLCCSVGSVRLPGDLSITRERFSLYAPIATSLVLSILLSLLVLRPFMALSPLTPHRVLQSGRRRGGHGAGSPYSCAARPPLLNPFACCWRRTHRLLEVRSEGAVALVILRVGRHEDRCMRRSTSPLGEMGYYLDGRRHRMTGQVQHPAAPAQPRRCSWERTEEPAR